MSRLDDRRRAKVLLVPDLAWDNLGDQFLFRAAVQLTRDALGRNVEITVLSDDARASPHGVRSCPPVLTNPAGSQSGVEGTGWRRRPLDVARALPRALKTAVGALTLLAVPRPWVARATLGSRSARAVDELRTADVVVQKGGGLFHSYGGPIESFALLYKVYPLLLARRIGVPRVILPNSFGPYANRFDRWLVSRALTGALHVAAREPISHQVLDALGIEAVIAPDMAFAPALVESLDGGAMAPAATRVLREAGLKDGEAFACITARPWRSLDRLDGARERYLQSLASGARAMVAEGLRIVLVAQSRGKGSHEDDRLALDELAEQLTDVDPIKVYAVDDAMLAYELYGRAQVILATRFHSALFALAASVPAAVIAYGGNKSRGILRMLHLEHACVAIEHVTPQGVTELISAALQLDRDDLAERVAAQRESVEAYWATVVDTLRAQLGHPV